MNELSTSTFSVETPPELPTTRIMWQTIQAANYEIDYQDQNPEFNVGLGEQSDYDDLEGETFYDRFCNNLQKNFENSVVLERTSPKVGELDSVYQVGLASWDWEERTIEVYCVTAALVVDDQYHYEIRAYCEKKHWESYAALFLQMWQGLKYFGDRQAALQEQIEAIEALHHKHNPPEPEKPAIKDFEAPSDGKNRFRLDGQDFEFLEETEYQISEMGRDLSVTIKAEVPEELKGNETLFCPYDSKEGAGFRFTFAGIHKDGVPTGVFDFEFGRTQDHSAYMWDDGWDYSLEFSGRAELRDGWIGLNGVMSKQWDAEEHFEIEVYHRIPLETLDWSQYQFSSLEETQGRQSSEVRYLNISTPEFEEIPPEIFNFTELRSLRIAGDGSHWAPNPCALKRVPSEIEKLQSLESLTLFSTSVTELPESLGNLKNLDSVFLSTNQLTSTPKSLWRLPKLTSLHLNHNKLTSLPEKIDLPLLSYLDISNNELPEVPDAIAQQPAIRKLLLADNPLTALADAFNDIPEIELSLEDKLKLLDFEYKGADGQGCIEWDEEAFAARSVPEFEEKLSGHSQAGSLLEVAKLALTFPHEVEEDYQTLGNTRFGGWPDLPASIPYPRFEDDDQNYAFEFLAQINCAELASLQSYLPREGILYFFLDHTELMNAKVLYWNGPLEELVSGSTIELTEDDFFELPDAPYQGYKVSCKAEISLPFSYASHTNTHYFKNAEDLLEPEDLLEDIEAELDLNDGQDDHQINSHVFTQHECPELQAALKNKGRAEDWMVLLKVASDGDFQWWDAGELFFVIHKSDFAKYDFSNIYVSLESS